MTAQDTILVVDDEEPVRQIIGTLLETEGYKVLQAADGKSCLQIAYEHHPDLVLLDILMPGWDGRQVCSLLRSASPDVGIIMISAVLGEQERVDRINDGADDYVTKPFHNEELMARIRAVLRRSKKPTARQTRSYRDARLCADFDAHLVTLDGVNVHLQPKLWRLFEYLVENKDRVVAREDLLRRVWGPGYEHDHKYLKVYIAHLRKALKENPEHPYYIHTARDHGYMFRTHL